jgi:hypothetical protein
LAYWCGTAWSCWHLAVLYLWSHLAMIMIPVRFCKNLVLFRVSLLYCRDARDASSVRWS